ncbi:DUF5667 domain-containing protein [Geodermatophilus sp. SYSU D00705]
MSTHDGAAPAACRRAAVRDREDAVVSRLQSLAAGLDDAPDPAFRAATRDRLVAMAAVRAPQPAPSRPRRALAFRAGDAATRPWRTRLTAGLAGAALTVTTLGALVALAADAAPGDVLYGVKRGTEQSRLALAGDSRGLTLLEFAGTRLAELDALDGTGSPQVVVALLDTMDAQASEGAALLAGQAVAGGDAALLRELGDWAAEQAAGLTDLRPRLPDGAAEAARESADLLIEVTERATGLATALGCPGGAATDGTDVLGPVPAPCPAEEPGAAPPADPTPQPSAPGGARRTADPGIAATPTTAPAPTSAPAAPGGAGSATPSAPPSAEAPAPAAPTVPVPAPRGGTPVPATPSLPPQVPTRTPPPPLVDTPLPICIPFLVC